LLNTVNARRLHASSRFFASETPSGLNSHADGDKIMNAVPLELAQPSRLGKLINGHDFAFHAADAA